MALVIYKQFLNPDLFWNREKLIRGITVAIFNMVANLLPIFLFLVKWKVNSFILYSKTVYNVLL